MGVEADFYSLGSKGHPKTLEVSSSDSWISFARALSCSTSQFAQTNFPRRKCASGLVIQTLKWAGNFTAMDISQRVIRHSLPEQSAIDSKAVKNRIIKEDQLTVIEMRIAVSLTRLSRDLRRHPFR